MAAWAHRSSSGGKGYLGCFGTQSVQRTLARPHSPRPPAQSHPSGFAMLQSTGTSFLPLLAGLGAGTGQQQQREGGEQAPGPRQTSAWLAKLTGSREGGRRGMRWAGRGPGDPGLSSGPVDQEPKLEKTQAFILGSWMATQGAQAPGGPEGRARGVDESEGRSNNVIQGRKEEKKPAGVGPPGEGPFWLVSS